MRKNMLNLDYIINADNYRNIQDSIANATDMAIITVDYKGKPITHHSKCTSLCKCIRSHSNLSQLCEKCDSRGGLEAARLNQPYIYLCHMGIVDFAIPLSVDGQYLGAVMGGQVRLENDWEMESLEKITSQQTSILNYVNSNELEELYKSLPVMKLEKIRANATMIYNICNYIVGEALLKINLSDGNMPNETLHSKNEKDSEARNLVEKKYYSGINSPIDTKGNGFPDNQEATTISQGGSKTANVFTQSTQRSQSSHESIILKPALDYIKKNYARNISLNNMASLCNISTSYFSKLFRRFIGENFSNYINKLRIEKAAELLAETDIPITNIALDLGYEDSGYFIKVFKKIKGVTPSAHRHEAFIKTYTKK